MNNDSQLDNTWDDRPDSADSETNNDVTDIILEELEDDNKLECSVHRC